MFESTSGTQIGTHLPNAHPPSPHLPGLVNGLCGAAWAQCEIGLLAESERLLSRAAAHPLLHDNMSLGFGYSGYGLACLKLWCTTSDRKLLKEACRVGDALLETFVRKEHGVAWTLDSLGHAGVGLHTGASGVALFLLYLAAATKDNRYLDLRWKDLITTSQKDGPSATSWAFLPARLRIIESCTPTWLAVLRVWRPWRSVPTC